MIKEYLTKAFHYFIYIFTCLWITLFISMPCIILTRFKFPMESVEESIILTLTMTIVMGISLYICTRRIGYSDREFHLRETLVQVILALVLQLIYASFFRFAVYSSGPAYFLGRTIYLINGGTDKGVPGVLVFQMMLLFDAIYIVISVIANNSGVKKREKEREKLISGGNK